jgi:hypothetical protein
MMLWSARSHNSDWWSRTWERQNAILYRHCDSSRPGHRRDELLERLWNVWLGDFFETSDWPGHAIQINHKVCVVWRVADVIDPVRDHFANPSVFGLVIDSYFEAFAGALAGISDTDPLVARQRWRSTARDIIGLNGLPRDRWDKSI